MRISTFLHGTNKTNIWLAAMCPFSKIAKRAVSLHPSEDCWGVEIWLYCTTLVKDFFFYSHPWPSFSNLLVQYLQSDLPPLRPHRPLQGRDLNSVRADLVAGTLTTRPPAPHLTGFQFLPIELAGVILCCQSVLLADLSYFKFCKLCYLYYTSQNVCCKFLYWWSLYGV